MAIETEIVKSLLGCLARNTLHCRRVTSVVSMIPAVVQHEQDTTCYAPALTTVLASIPPRAQVATTSIHHSPCVDREGVEGFGQVALANEGGPSLTLWTLKALVRIALASVGRPNPTLWTLKALVRTAPQFFFTFFYNATMML